jgi:sec-independent protein translocase protein TatB
MNLGMPEMIFIFLLALLLFGPKKLPQVGRELGKALSEFKRASNDFKQQLETEIEQVESLEREKAAQLPESATQSQVQVSEAPADEPRILPPSEPTVASSLGPEAVEMMPASAPSDPSPAQGSGTAPERVANAAVPYTGEGNAIKTTTATGTSLSGVSAFDDKVTMRETNA